VRGGESNFLPISISPFYLLYYNPQFKDSYFSLKNYCWKYNLTYAEQILATIYPKLPKPIRL